MGDIRSETKRRQDEIREMGKAAARCGASEKVKNHMKDKHCHSQDERDEYDKGVRSGG